MIRHGGLVARLTSTWATLSVLNCSPSAVVLKAVWMHTLSSRIGHYVDRRNRVQIWHRC